MFSLNPEKNCVRPESCSPSRNASVRFPMGIPPLGDENQQINRIQLAVQKYNNSSLIPVNNRSGFSWSGRQCLLKNTLRSKNYETDEGLAKSEKKSGNHYEGVGAFPTIHLRKSAIRYRPIRKFHDVKVPYPELPVNRYLSHLPELCTDIKSSTRSVLDVLQDLSAKKIQDEDDGNGKSKSKGLAGDFIMDPNAVYKPLFVQKPKLSSVTMRDSMTQTSSTFRSDTPSPQICSLNSRNDVSDPKAELRKKLAKQNNEISASLSSSIPSYAIKRKIDKVTAKDDDQSPEVSAVKRSRIDRIKQAENGFANSTNSRKEPAKPNRKLKLIEATSPSPNKDRLTTIFLDIRNTSPKSKIFQDQKSDMPKSNGVCNGFSKNSSSVFTGSAEVVKTPEVSVEESPKTDSEKLESEPKSLPSLPMSKPEGASKQSTPTCQFGLSNNINFNFKPTDTPLKEVTRASDTNVKDAAGNDKKDEPPKTFSFGSNGTSFSGFKFGTDVPKSPVGQKTEGLGVATTTAPATTTQFTFGVKNSVTQSPVSTQSTFTTPGKSLFTFGQSPPSSVEASKNSTSPALMPSVVQNTQAGMFTFGQKAIAESSCAQTSTQASLSTTSPSSTQASSDQISVPLTTAPTNGLFSFGQKVEATSTTVPTTTVAEQKSQLTFSFGQKTDLSKPPEMGQKNLFTFGQKSTSETNEARAVTTSSQTPVSSPTFGQTSVSQPSVSFGTTTFGGFGTPAISTSAATTLPQPAIGVSTVQAPSLATTAQSTPVFGISTTATSLFGTSTMTAPTFGTSTTTTPAFGGSIQPTFKFGASTTQTTQFAVSSTSHASPTTTTITTTAITTTSATTTTTQAAPAFGINNSQPTPAFGTSSSAQSTPVFGVATTQSTPTFGVSSASLAFGTSTTTAFGTAVSSGTSMFGISSSPMQSLGTPTTQNAFGTPTTQTTPAFSTSTSQSIPAFGTSSLSAFGAPSTVQSTSSFGSSTATSTFGALVSNGFGPSSSQPNSIFGTPASTQSGFGGTTSTSVFGTSGGFGATSSQSNTGFETSGGTQTTSAFGFGKPSAPSVFGQNTAPAFPSGNNLMQNQTIFGAKPNDKEMFGQNKMFGSQNNFQFGSTANSTRFTTSAPTTAPVFSFGGGAATNTFSFSGNSSTGSSNTQTPFAFTPNEPFKFGAANSKENTGFGAGASPNFNFGNQMNNTAPSTGFDFRPGQNSAASGFNFSAGSSSSPSVFSFGGSSSSSSNGRGFNFGAQSPGAAFGQPAPSFGVPGTFSIGSGSGQSRSRAGRLRRRP